jgi:hypothetical protein
VLLFVCLLVCFLFFWVAIFWFAWLFVDFCLSGSFFCSVLFAWLRVVFFVLYVCLAVSSLFFIAWLFVVFCLFVY